MARSATTVLPEPTSPCSSRCIGWPAARSSRIARPTSCWPSVSSNGSRSSNAVEQAAVTAGARAGASRARSAARRWASTVCVTKASSKRSRFSAAPLLGPAVRAVQPAAAPRGRRRSRRSCVPPRAAARGPRGPGRARARSPRRAASSAPRRSRGRSVTSCGICPTRGRVLASSLAARRSGSAGWSAAACRGTCRPCRRTARRGPRRSWPARQSAMCCCLSKNVSVSWPSSVATVTSRR